ncbi:MAG: UDP-N-acetylmuramoyl-L-alanyl-D-glutamate--2,6-diaminopimelate ligase [Armatimonadetes bacterium JP3_11]|nr:MAG: UDP-N-acetylmuramoyl-L-alanyl-D-glutamate--2,6-diaminopimelate ligase [Armatimonadetes bacterium JP3_11]
MRLSELVQGLPVLWAQGDAEISGIGVDSRQMQAGDLFVAIVGRTHDGHQFIKDAIARGAAAILVQGNPTRSSLSAWGEGVQALYAVPNTRDALWRIAQRFYGDPSRTLLTIGVTGTNGKTTTTHMLQKILVAWGTPTLIVGTLGAWIDYPDGTRLALVPEGEFTTPEVYQLQSLLKTARERGAGAVVMEVSSHALDQQRVDGIHFDAAVFTNLTQDHLDYHGTMEAYAAAKLRLFTELAEQSEKPFKAIINIDDEWGKQFAAKARGTVYTYGLSECAQVRATRVEYGLDGLKFEIRYQWTECAIAIPLIAPYNLYNALAAVATALALGAPMDAIQHGLAGLEQVAGRFQRVPIDADYEVIVDFAHTPDALQRVLQAGRMLNPTRLTVLFGCGGDRDATKRPLMGKLAAELADRVILTSDNPRTEDPHAILEQILAGVPVPLRPKVERVEVDRRRAIEYALQTAQAGELILLAGKGHEPYQIIGTEKVPFSDIEVAKEVAGAKR